MKLKEFSVITFFIFIFLSNIISCQENQVITTGKGKIVFQNPELIDGKPTNVYYYMPSNYSSDSKILFVIHGVNRNADEYRDQWSKLAEKYNALLIVPEFSLENFPLDQDYNMGHIFKMTRADSILGNNDKSLWSFSLIEPIFDYVKLLTGNKSEGYYLYGHSAGAQFVQRFILFIQEARFLKAISANAGWYTMVDFYQIYPYGLGMTNLNKENIQKTLKKNYILLLGTEDNDPNNIHLRKSPQANLQGTHRLERAKTFFNNTKTFAEENGFKFNWILKFVEGVGHSNSKMSKFAAELLFDGEN